jgi:hypothetical protein
MDHWILIINGILKLFVFVIIGTALGSILEYKGWTNYISFLIKPILRFGKLPSICGTSLITAIFSNSAASAIIAGAKRDGHINRREMIVTGVSGTFPTHISHLTKALFILIPLIGPVAIVYYLLVFVSDLIRTFIVLLYNRIFSNRLDFTVNINTAKENLTWKEIIRKTNRRIIRIVKKLAIIYLPLYIFVSYLAHIGFFKTINYHIPVFLNKILSPEIVSIAVSKIGGLTASATVANTLLVNSKVLPIQVLMALLIGNMITIPFNTLRRSLPATVAIFPGKDGLWIVLITESIRFLLNLITIIILFLLINTLYFSF